MYSNICKCHLFSIFIVYLCFLFVEKFVVESIQYTQGINQCLRTFDQYCSIILESEEWEDCSREVLEILLARNTLRYVT